MSGTEKPSSILSTRIRPQIKIHIVSPRVTVMNTTIAKVFPVVGNIFDRYCVSNRLD